MVSTLFSTGILIGIMVIFSILFSRGQKKGRAAKIEQQNDLIDDIISDNMPELTEKETFNHYFLGIDRKNFLLLYLNFNNQSAAPVLIDVRSIKRAKVITEVNNIYKKVKGKSVLVDNKIRKLKIQITFLDGGPGVDMVLNDQRITREDFLYIKKRVGRWCRLINKAMEEIQPSLNQRSEYA